MRDLPLDCVHRELQSSRDDAADERSTIRLMDAVTRYGFLHLGHFAARYKERFAQAPSETLRRRFG